MAETSDDAASPDADKHRFHTTQWNLVLAAGRTPTPASRKALSTLCEIYWYPLYAFARRQGYQADDALDLTQGFFARLLERNDIASADQSRGRFRSWLLAAFKHYMANEYHKSTAQKRGGGQKVLSIDFSVDEAEGRYKLEPAHQMTAERVFDRRWALTLLDQVLQRLKRDLEGAGKAKLFAKLKPFLTAGANEGPYREVAAELGMSEGAVKVAVHRLRRKYRDLLADEIAQTVERPEEIEQEIGHLLASLSGG